MSESTSATTIYKGIKNAEGLKLLASESITVVVGTSANTKTWHLPRDLLTKSSPFFAAALNGSFAEAKSKVVNLPEDNTDAFALFIQWLYVGEISPDDCTANHDHDAHSCYEIAARNFIQAWILGDKLGCPIFKDLAMLGLIKKFDEGVITPDIVRTAYERSATGSKLRKFSLDQVRYDALSIGLECDADEWVYLARDCVDFGEDHMRATFHKDINPVKDPCEQKAKYLEVLTAEDT